jgi:transcriptional regulator with XRE-family HTH domain
MRAGYAIGRVDPLMKAIPLPTDDLTSEQFNRHVGRRVREIRLRAGKSQEEMGALIGVTFQQIQKYEKGANKISLENLWRLCQVLGVEVEFFLPGGEAAGLAAGSSIGSTRLRLEIARAVQHIGSAQLLRNVLNIVRSLRDVLD